MSRENSAVRSGRTKHFVVSLAIAIVLIALHPAVSLGQSGALQLTENLPAGAMQQKTTRACAECHEARIIVQQRLSKAAWTKEVDKMIRWGAVVDSADHDGIIDYLSTNFGVDQPAYNPPKTASEKNSKGKK